MDANNPKVISNHHWRFFKYFQDLSDKQQQEVLSDYDYMDEDEIHSSSWIVYRNRIYSLNDFMRVDHMNPGDWLSEWHGYFNDSYFSGIVIRLSECGDAYQIATFY